MAADLDDLEDKLMEMFNARQKFGKRAIMTAITKNTPCMRWLRLIAPI